MFNWLQVIIYKLSCIYVLKGCLKGFLFYYESLYDVLRLFDVVDWLWYLLVGLTYVFVIFANIADNDEMSPYTA